jgi:chemotaxis protein MotB
VRNGVAIEGHLSAKSVLRVDNPVWELSTDRAAQMRLMLQRGGLDPMRVMRQTGAGDREPAVRDATAPRNNRIEVVLLRSDI